MLHSPCCLPETFLQDAHPRTPEQSSHLQGELPALQHKSWRPFATPLQDIYQAGAACAAWVRVKGCPVLVEQLLMPEVVMHCKELDGDLCPTQVLELCNHSWDYVNICA